MKTRQQRLAEERAGHPPSPPQSLPVNQRAIRRARSKTPGATVAAGSIVAAAQSAVLGEPQALLRVWVDAGPKPSGQSAHDPTHQMMFRLTHLPQVVALLDSICNGSNETPSSHQGIPGQEMEEPIEPKKPEPATADKPAKRRKNAFQRNPTMGISARLRASHDTSAVDGIPMIFRDDFDFAANEPGYTVSQQRDDKLSADGDCTMNDVSETGNTVGQWADSLSRQPRPGLTSPHKLRVQANGAWAVSTSPHVQLQGGWFSARLARYWKAPNHPRKRRQQVRLRP